MRDYGGRWIGLAGLLLLIVVSGHWAWEFAHSREIAFSLHDAMARQSLEGGLGQDVLRIGEESRVALFAHAPSRLEWPLRLRRGQHRFSTSIALSPDAWQTSNGVEFRVLFVEGGREAVVLSEELNPRDVESDRRWRNLETQVKTKGGEVVLVLETRPGPDGRIDFDWAHWGDPTLTEGPPPFPIGWLFLSLLFLGIGILPPFGSKSLPAGLPISIFVLSVMVAIGIVEAFFRFAPERYPVSAFQHLAYDGLCEIGDRHNLRIDDNELGYRLPGPRCSRYGLRFDAVLEGSVSPAWVESDKTQIEFCVDHRGFRNPESLLSAETAFVGDSFVQGSMIARDSTWPMVFASKTGQSVANFGVGGYAPRQSLMALQRHAEELGLRRVVFALFEGNDVNDEEQFSQWRESALPWGQFLALEGRARGATRTTYRYEHSLARGFLVHLLESWRVVRGRPERGTEPQDFPMNQPFFVDLAEGTLPFAFTRLELERAAMSESEWKSLSGWQSLRTVLRDFRAWSHDMGVEAWVVLIPTKADVYRFALDAENLDSLPALHGPLLDLIAENDLDPIDLWPEFRRAAQDGQLLYFPFDSHWNEAGHALAGQIVAREIESGARLESGIEEETRTESLESGGSS